MVLRCKILHFLPDLPFFLSQRSRAATRFCQRRSGPGKIRLEFPAWCGKRNFSQLPRVSFFPGIRSVQQKVEINSKLCVPLGKVWSKCHVSIFFLLGACATLSNLNWQKSFSFGKKKFYCFSPKRTKFASTQIRKSLARRRGFDEFKSAQQNLHSREIDTV